MRGHPLPMPRPARASCAVGSSARPQSRFRQPLGPEVPARREIRPDRALAPNPPQESLISGKRGVTGVCALPMPPKAPDNLIARQRRKRLQTASFPRGPKHPFRLVKGKQSNPLSQIGSLALSLRRQARTSAGSGPQTPASPCQGNHRACHRPPPIPCPGTAPMRAVAHGQPACSPKPAKSAAPARC